MYAVRILETQKYAPATSSGSPVLVWPALASRSAVVVDASDEGAVPPATALRQQQVLNSDCALKFWRWWAGPRVDLAAKYLEVGGRQETVNGVGVGGTYTRFLTFVVLTCGLLTRT